MDEKQKYELLDVSTRKPMVATGKDAELINKVAEYRKQSAQFLKDSHDSDVFTVGGWLSVSADYREAPGHQG